MYHPSLRVVLEALQSPENVEPPNILISVQSRQGQDDQLTMRAVLSMQSVL